MNYSANRSKALSESAAQRCEEAKEPVCRCRCGGKHHGAKRGRVRELALDDPHSPSKNCSKCGGKGEYTFADYDGMKTFKCGKCDGTGKILPTPKKEGTTMRHANYCMVEDDLLQEEPLVIQDVGPWDKYPTITNDVEWVVAQLIGDGQLPAGRRLIYIDSEGYRDEILIENGKFAGFAHIGKKK